MQLLTLELPLNPSTKEVASEDHSEVASVPLDQLPTLRELIFQCYVMCRFCYNVSRLTVHRLNHSIKEDSAVVFRDQPQMLRKFFLSFFVTKDRFCELKDSFARSEILNN